MDNEAGHQAADCIGPAAPAVPSGWSEISCAVLAHLREELGSRLFHTLVVRAAVADAADRFATGSGEVAATPAGSLHAWCDAVQAAGWGCCEVLELDMDGRRARLLARDPWELRAQNGLDASRRWGCPLLSGMVSELFQRVWGEDCYVDEQPLDTACGLAVEFAVTPASSSLDARIHALRRQRAADAAADAPGSVADAFAIERQAIDNRNRELLRARARELRQEITARERAERAKDDLISNVSHELRTPLTSLRGFVELVRHREMPLEQRQHFLDIVLAESERLSRLIDDLLDLQGMERGDCCIELEPVDLLPVLRAGAELFSGATHRVQLDTLPVLPLVLADVHRVQQVLANLLGNAIKFSADADRVELRASVEDQRVVIQVRDHGLGMPAEALPKLFERFYRVDDAASRGIRGTGLGLAIAKQIVDQHGGDLWVESSPGVGSTFSFRLQLAESTAASAARRT